MQSDFENLFMELSVNLSVILLNICIAKTASKRFVFSTKTFSTSLLFCFCFHYVFVHFVWISRLKFCWMFIIHYENFPHEQGPFRGFVDFLGKAFLISSSQALEFSANNNAKAKLQATLYFWCGALLQMLVNNLLI